MPDYAVTKDGRVFRVTQYAHGRAVPFEMKPRLDSDGYVLVGQHHKVHRMVAESFVPNPDNLPEVRHKDGVRHHNSEDNLEWGTHLDNMLDMDRHGTRPIGEQRKISKLTVDLVREARIRAAKGESHVDIAQDMPVDRSVLSRAIRGDTWRHV
ncbi:HNH endonuclease [Mesorhizobium sp. M0139]|uniref:HNH endonuclease n=1 Tax=Mesorhizobium sp. M0139 TaxID=2956892 RepID=UPI00333B53E4